MRTQADGSIFFPTRPATPRLHRNVPLITVDEYLASNAITELDILHADIQGQELEMLLGADTCLRKRQVAFMFISAHFEDDHHQTCLQAVRDYGYQVFAEHSVGFLLR